MTRAVALRQPADAHRMNKTEAAWGQMLSLGYAVAGEVPATVMFEALTLRLGHHLRYTPDFMVVTEAGTVELHEVKGRWREDARAKIKAAAHQFPMFRFVAVRKQRAADGGGWDVEEIKS